MNDWTPKRRPASSTVDLDRDERFLLTRVDGNLTVEDLAALAGISRGTVESILERLVAHGAVVRTEAPPVYRGVVIAEPVSEEEAASLPELEVLEDDGGDDLAVPVDGAMSLALRRSSVPADPANLAAAEETVDEMPSLDELPTALAGDEAPDEELADEARDAEIGTLGTDASHLQMYAMKYRHLSVDQRIALVSGAAGTTEPPPEEMALDPDPHVLRALFENPRTHPAHARLAAFHHRSAWGLDSLARRGDLLRDSQVQRLLLRNPQTGEALVRRILQPRRLAEIYKATLDRDIPDRTRAAARNVLRQSFTKAPAEDRFALLWSTEARVLATLVGCTLDSRTTALLCSKPVASVMLVQNFARWGATPPALLAHFLKQSFVRRHAALKRLLLAHPNTPSDAKKGL